MRKRWLRNVSRGGTKKIHQARKTFRLHQTMSFSIISIYISARRLPVRWPLSLVSPEPQTYVSRITWTKMACQNRLGIESNCKHTVNILQKRLTRRVTSKIGFVFELGARVCCSTNSFLWEPRLRSRVAAPSFCPSPEWSKQAVF